MEKFKNGVKLLASPLCNNVAGTEDEGISKGGNITKAALVVAVGAVVIVAMAGVVGTMSGKLDSVIQQLSNLFP